MHATTTLSTIEALRQLQAVAAGDGPSAEPWPSLGTDAMPATYTSTREGGALAEETAAEDVEQYQRDTLNYAIGDDLVVDGVTYDRDEWMSDGEGGVQSWATWRAEQGIVTTFAITGRPD